MSLARASISTCLGRLKVLLLGLLKEKHFSVDVSCYVTYQAYIESKRQGVKLIRLRIIKPLNIEHRFQECWFGRLSSL